MEVKYIWSTQHKYVLFSTINGFWTAEIFPWWCIKVCPQLHFSIVLHSSSLDISKHELEWCNYKKKFGITFKLRKISHRKYLIIALTIHIHLRLLVGKWRVWLSTPCKVSGNSTFPCSKCHSHLFSLFKASHGGFHRSRQKCFFAELYAVHLEHIFFAIVAVGILSCFSLPAMDI